MGRTWAFIDEYGNPNLDVDVEGASTYFIVAAVMVRDSELLQVRAGLEEIRSGFFQTGEMKSSTLGKKLHRWKALLARVDPLPWKFSALVVDKRALDRASGLQWKQSFYKYLCGRAYQRLFAGVPELHVVADHYGTDEFSLGFRRYIERYRPRTLFEPRPIELVNSKHDVLVQLADVLAGVLARTYDPKKRLGGSAELLREVRDHLLVLDDFPRLTGVRPAHPRESASEKLDLRIAQLALDRASEYVEKTSQSDDADDRCRVAVVERLIYEVRFGQGLPTPTHALLSHLTDSRLGRSDENWFRRVVVAHLRDRGVLITSSSSGYKIPESEADLLSFAKHADSVCVPMLNRVATACDAVKEATLGDVDVLAAPQLSAVRAMISAIGDRRTVDDGEEP